MTINTVSNMKIDLNDMLSRIREVSNKNKAFDVSDNKHTPEVKKNNFSDVLGSLSNVLDNVNTIQNKTDSIKNAYLLGDKNTSLADVIVSSQKSKLAFEGLVTVRNKILEAYKEVMNMPV